MFEISYFVLAALLLFECVIIWELIPKVNNLRRILHLPPSPDEDLEQYSTNLKEIPEFSVTSLTLDRRLNREDVLGLTSLFLFIDQQDRVDRGDVPLSAVIQAMISKTDQSLYLVFGGSTEDCKAFSNALNLDETYGDDLILIPSPDRNLFILFQVKYSPFGIYFNKKGETKKFGALTNTDELENEQLQA